jgi:hypothetical protein
MNNFKILIIFTVALSSLYAHSSSIDETIKLAVEKSLPKSLSEVKSAEIIEIASSFNETLGCLVSPLKCNNKAKEFDTIIRLLLENHEQVDFQCKISGTKRSSKILISVYDCKDLAVEKRFYSILEGKSISFVEDVPK